MGRTRAEVLSEKRRKESERSEREARVRALEEKIRRLEEARKRVKTAKDNVGTIKDDVKKQSDQDSWKGEKKDKYSTLIDGVFAGDFKSYHDRVDDLLDAIMDEKTRLENEKYNETSRIG